MGLQRPVRKVKTWSWCIVPDKVTLSHLPNS
jgi:hypothetical protein